MKFDQHLGITDSIIVIMSLLVPSAIGIFFRFSSGRQKTMEEYFFAGRSASKMPVIMSITASTVSSILILGNSSEAYRFGLVLGGISVPCALGMITSCYVFVPVYFQCKVSSVYEFLEVRFGKLTRCTVAFMYNMQMILYSSCVLYGPALVLNSVSNISVELAIILCGGICTFYCFLGGLKAVLWTDVFQQILMFMCMFALIFAGLQEVGLGEFYKRTLAGGRLNIFNFSVDLTQRYTTWNVFIRGFCMALGFFGTGQVFVQRFLSLGGCKEAQSVLLWSIIPVSICAFFAGVIGIVLYAVFYLCDPILNPQTGLQKYDQLVPYFMISRFHSIPGLTGICIAGIFSGALSTISSLQNALAMSTVIDFIQPLFSEKLTEKSLLLIGKAQDNLYDAAVNQSIPFSAIVYGAIFIGLSLAISKVDSMLASAMLSHAVFEGPIVVIFLIGVLTRKATDKVIVTSLVIGVTITGWIGFNMLFSGYRHSPLPLEASGCLNSNFSVIIANSLNSSCTALKSCLIENVEKPHKSEILFLYKIAPFWLSFIGIFSTIFIVLSLVLITGWNKNQIPADSKCLSPVTRYWFKQKGCSNTSLRRENHIKVIEDEDRI